MQMISIPLHSTTNSYHLGNNDEVVDAKGVVQQVTNYYPFGAPYADASATLNTSLQAYKYNGKEFDNMHGLNTYDYGARQYNPVTARWDRIDPLCEKYYSTSPYAYCVNNPVRFIDPDGRMTGDYHDINGNFLASDGIKDGKKYMVVDETEAKKIKQTKDVSNVSSAMSTPTNSQMDKAQTCIDKGQKTQLETGFVMGGGLTFDIITGGPSSIILSDGYDQLGGSAECDAHYQPFDLRVEGDKVSYSTSEPSQADFTMRRVREENKVNNSLNPSWVIGEEPRSDTFLRGTDGKVIAPPTTTSIRFVRNGKASKPMSWNKFKKAVHKINGKN